MRSPMKLVSCLVTSVRRVMTASMEAVAGSAAGACCAVAAASVSRTPAGRWTGLGVGTAAS